MMIPSNKAFGLYSSPFRIVRLARHIVSYPLSCKINKLVETAMYPSKLKRVKVLPTFKNGDETIPSNYMHISLLSVFNRIFEKLLYNSLKAYVDKQDVFYKSQYVFRDNHSTQYSIFDIITKYKHTYLVRYFYRSTKGIRCCFYITRTIEGQLLHYAIAYSTEPTIVRIVIPNTDHSLFIFN